MKPNICLPDSNLVALFNAGLLKLVPYADATYRYYCYALPGTALTATDWLVKRETIASGILEFSGGGFSFDYPATNISVVGALSFS